jgi:hypothetical protein
MSNFKGSRAIGTLLAQLAPCFRETAPKSWRQNALDGRQRTPLGVCHQARRECPGPVWAGRQLAGACGNLIHVKHPTQSMGHFCGSRTRARTRGRGKAGTRSRREGRSCLGESWPVVDGSATGLRLWEFDPYQAPYSELGMLLWIKDPPTPTDRYCRFLARLCSGPGFLPPPATPRRDPHHVPPYPARP